MFHKFECLERYITEKKTQQIYGTKLSFYTLYWNPDVPSVPNVLFLGDPISWPDSVGTWTKGTILPLAFLKNLNEKKQWETFKPMEI